MTDVPHFTSFYDMTDVVDARRQFIIRVFSDPPALPPNSAYFYDNLNYIMAGLIIDLLPSDT